MAKITIIGSGVVGKATGKGFIEKGHKVVFCDINPDVLEKLKKESYAVCLPENLFLQKDVDAFFLCVSTPTIDSKIHLEFLKSAVANLGKDIKKRDNHPLIVMRSTLPPGTTENILIPLIEKYSTKKAGKDFKVCVNPEYLRENRSENDFKNPWIIIIGELDKDSGDALEKLYGKVSCPLLRLAVKEAEIQKYIHNIFNACKISFFNEMRKVCEVMGINSDKVFELVVKSAEGSWNPRYGIKNLGPFGGSCLPKDTTAFLNWAKEKKIDLNLLRAVIKVNELLKDKTSNNSEN
jgi:UDPglucose 6-dehydrogenase